MSIDRSTVVAALRTEDVIAHFQIAGQWRGRWLRSRRCGVADHDGEAFGIARDGHWHCHACSSGGDLLRLIALGHKLDLQRDFPRILEIAAGIAGVEDTESFGGSAPHKPVERAPLAPVAPLHERVALAKRRAAWVWDRLVRREETPRSCADLYLAGDRKLDHVAIRKLEELRETPLRGADLLSSPSEDLKRLTAAFAAPGLAIPVRAVDDGRLVDVRIRRYEPREGQPKIIGMLGGVTTHQPDRGGVRQLIGCYGHPECIDPGPSLLVVVCEGALDYLTALQVWPDAQVLSAVDAGSMGLVAAHAAHELANYPGARLLLVEQADQPWISANGTPMLGSGDRSINEDVNAASKRAIAILGPRRVGWLRCEYPGHTSIKDLNDLVQAGESSDGISAMIRWWSDLGPDSKL